MMLVCALHRLDMGLHSQLPAAPACSGTCIWHRAQSCPNLSLPPVCKPSSTSCSGAGTCMCPERQPPSAVQRPAATCAAVGAGPAVDEQAERGPVPRVARPPALLLRCLWSTAALAALPPANLLPERRWPDQLPAELWELLAASLEQARARGTACGGAGAAPTLSVVPRDCRSETGPSLLPVTQAGTVPSPGGPAPLNRVAGPMLVVGGLKTSSWGVPSAAFQ